MPRLVPRFRRVPSPPATEATPPRSQLAPAAHDELLALASGVQKNDPSATRTFLTTIIPVLLRVVRRVLGATHPELEDVTYEAAHAVLSALPGFRGEGTVRHFACRIAVLTAMNVRRRDAASKRWHDATSIDPERCESLGPGPEQTLLSASLIPIVRELIGTLPEALAEALTLHVILGFTVPEIALGSKVSPETVRSRLRLAKQALRKAALHDPVLREALEVEP